MPRYQMDVYILNYSPRSYEVKPRGPGIREVCSEAARILAKNNISVVDGVKFSTPSKQFMHGWMWDSLDSSWNCAQIQLGEVK